jgi:SAM-dependent methyltransferase
MARPPLCSLRAASAGIVRGSVEEILDHLPPGSRVLDLGSRDGSFQAQAFPNLILIAADLFAPATLQPGIRFVQSDAGELPFASRSFDAIILNHTLEHFERLKPALQEIGRVVRTTGAIYVAVPDATTFSDRLYRKLFRNRGGHVNLFGSETELSKMLAWYFGLRPAGSRKLCASLTFLDRNARNPEPGQLRLPFRLPERLLLYLTWLMRAADRRLGVRLTIYGWALYFGNLQVQVDPTVRTNICIRCGQAHPSAWLLNLGAVRRRRWLFDHYSCPGCRARNIFIPENPVTSQ